MKRLSMGVLEEFKEFKEFKESIGGARLGSEDEEWWSNGVLEYWSIGVLERWSFGMLRSWSAPSGNRRIYREAVIDHSPGL